jgi:hypothetical protein
MEIAENHEVNLLLPESVTRPLWRSLLQNLRDRVSPEKLPPLALTSRPMEIGMLLGDILSLPWYRTVFTNLGNVITPETLPPLELESRPVNVGELISDRLSHLWWSSLLRNLADAVSPEPLPPLELTSIPAHLGPEVGSLHLVRWSSLLSTPKVFLPDAPKPAPSPVAARVAAPPLRPLQAQASPLHSETHRIKGRLSRSRLREALLISAAVLEMLYLVASYIGWM